MNKENNYITFSSQEELENYASDNGLYYVLEEFDPWEEGKEYEIIDIIDPENSERIIPAIINEEDVGYYESQRELKIMRNEETMAKRLFEYLEKGTSLTKEEIEEYNEYALKGEGELRCLNQNDSNDVMMNIILDNSCEVA